MIKGLALPGIVGSHEPGTYLIIHFKREHGLPTENSTEPEYLMQYEVQVLL
jgi:hypothetical protein